ncbi:hypothetical protein [Aliivibrio wodanis]|uniref:hypothetical protein n=1 Tax=Aliivibrio wodanis TaxID=80852 RepID=UPI00406BEC26
MNKLSIIALLVSSVLIGCVHLTPLELPILTSDIQAQTYTYNELTGKKNELWEKARQHILIMYGKNQPVIRVANQTNGTLIGRGVIGWKILPSSQSYCYSKYDFRLMVRDDKARFLLQLLPGVLAKSNCEGRELPSQYGYKKIIDEFDIMSDKLESVLRE